MQMGGVMTPWETISGLKLAKFIIKLQDTCPFMKNENLFGDE